ncbi:MAG: hypothetical protein EXS58_17995 [Candidatus Latescibacteria bacterium]|nr:hypothetical protein [Candidatus Latescibacterota bacterium]
MNRARHSGAARRWWYLVWSGVLLLALAAGCAVKKPQVPRTKFKISIPVADDRTLMSKVAGDRDYLKLDSTGRLNLNFTTEFGKNGRQEIGDRLSIKPNDADFSTAIGDIEIPGQQIPENRIPMSSLLPGVATGTVPLIRAAQIDQQVNIPLADIETIKIKEGSLSVTLRNGLPLTLANMRLTLVDLGKGGATVGLVDLGQLNTGSEKTGVFDLAGKDISGNLSIAVSGSTVEATDVAVSSSASLDVLGGLSDLIVTEAAALIPQQEFAASQSLGFPDDRIQVTSAVIRKAKLTFEVTNNIPLVIELDIALDDMKKPDGSANVFHIERLNQNEVVTAVFDLTDNNFAPINPLELRFSYAAKTIPSTTPVRIISGSVIGVKVITDTLAFSRVEGILNRLSLPIPSVDKELDFPDGLDNIALSSTSMQVFMTSAVGFRSTLNLDIAGTSKTGRQGQLNINAVIDRGDPDNPKSLILGPSSSELTTFLNVLPAQLTVNPNVLLGDNSGVEVIEPDHWVKLDSLKFIAPARLRISADSQIQTDPQRRVFNDATARERINSNLDSAAVETAIESHLPIGIHVSLLVGTTPDQVFTNPILRIPRQGGFGVNAAPVDAQGRVTQSLNSTQRITIGKEDALVFLRPGGVYTGILIELDQTAGGNDIDLLGTDFVDVKATAEIFMELNEDLVK